MSGIFLDPVEDGKPSRSFVLYGFAVVMLIPGLWFLSTGQLWDALDALALAYIAHAFDKLNRNAWERGYLSAARSVKRQVEDHD